MAGFGAQLKGLIDAKTVRELAGNLDIHTVGALLRHFPRTYVKRGELTQLGAERAGEHVTVQAQVVKCHHRPMRNRPGYMLEVEIHDGHGNLRLTWFGKQRGVIEWRAKQLQVGRVGLFAGKVDEYKGTTQLTHPEYVLLDDDPVTDAETYAGALIPVYPATVKLPSWNIAKAVGIVLDIADLADITSDPIPSRIRAEHDLYDQRTAYERIHRPRDWGDVTLARKRLKWDEAFVLQAAFARRRAEAAATPARPRTGRAGGLLDAFDAQLPFELTAGQREVAQQLATDIAAPHPMHRLLQGEVGSGKTVVALRAMLTVVDSGGQAVLLAPTEVLAQQHYRSVTDLLGPLAQAGQLGGADDATSVVLLTGAMSAATRRTALLDTASGSAGIVIGTHALLEEKVQFADLGLVVVDEQHRFGVEQRDALRSKADEPPHVLVMTATPIPRTVAITVYGDLEISTLSELPAGRADVQTTVIAPREKPEWLERAWQRIREEVAAGHQAFVVCPRIGDASADDDVDMMETLDEERAAATVLEMHPTLARGPLNGLRVEMLHGRMASEDKDAVMRRFAAGDVDVLVATTVIEVGVDVPNATVMVVLDADRFGVSQLHQLRGRIGRGSAPGVCLLVTDARGGTPARERLHAVAETHDGFRLSELDLEQRREGDVLGTDQAGRRRTLRMLSVVHDADLIRAARDAAASVVESDPELADHPELAAAIEIMLEPEQADYLEKG